MPALLLEMESPAIPAPKVPEYGFVVSHQKVELEVDFATQSVTGRVEITIIPQRKDLRSIRIDARQCTIPDHQVMVNGKVATHSYEDPMRLLDIPAHYVWTADQYEMQKDRLKPIAEEDTRAEGALEITIPKSVHIYEVDPFSDMAVNAFASRTIGAPAVRNSSVAVNGGNDPLSATSLMTPRPTAEQSARFQPLVISIPFSVKTSRDGLHFVGLGEGDARFPHVYTRHSMEPGTASCIFPCIDDPAMRCTWEIFIKCSRTLGDALKRPPPAHSHKAHHTKKAHANGINGLFTSEECEAPLDEDEKLLEMMVVCSGEIMNEVVDLADSSKKVVSFLCSTVVAAQHIGFAIGPFEQIDLSEFREDEDEEKLGQSQALPVSGYCLPARAEEVRNTCAPLAHALDWFSLRYATFPFTEYKLVFIDDQIRDVEHTAGLSLCSTRLLFPEEIIDPEHENTRILVHAIATQWIGVSVVPNQRTDRWVTIGLSYFMTGLFMKALCGTNDYNFRQKTLADKLVELDINRPSLHALGEVLHLGPFEYDFMALKAPLVMFILDKRIVKASGSAGLIRVIAKIVLGASTGAASESVLSTEGFRKFCEKITKYRQTEPFWNQWVLGAGCPRFLISQKFNKKRLMVEMKILQKQDTLPTQRKLIKGEFLREFKEEVGGVFAGELQPLFTGPMTIRIHEADGTPYEHIVEIREGQGVIEIPYNTKYKRLKRSRRQKERANAGAGVDVSAEPGEDALIYCLGDILQSQQDMQEWGLADWDQQSQLEMEQESYEWIRIDADFEWLCDKQLVSMKPWMYISQLQQDRDVVAQQESMLWLKGQEAHPLAATFLIRTLMDPRYFHGIRTLAAECLTVHADPVAHWVGLRHLEKAFQELFCYPGSKMPRSNDFSDKQAYWVANSIPKAVAQIRNIKKCPKEARQFVLDQLRFNDNGNNEYSDNYKVANLLIALTECLMPAKEASTEEILFDDDDEDDDEPRKFRNIVIEELDRYRRMDEWTHSYQNIYTTTVLACKQKLMKARVIPQDPLEFAQYLHDGTSDFVRIKAFEALVDLGLITNDAVVTLLLNLLSSDSSPYVRSRLFQVFSLGLATVALGENKPVEAQVEPDGDTLIIEQDASNEARKAHIARTTSIDGALTALKEELKDNMALKDAIWKGIKSPLINLNEQSDLLDICFVLYDAVECLVVKLRYPRYWAVENHGKGLVIFKKTEKVRTKIILKTKPKALPEPAVKLERPGPPPVRLSFTGTSMGPPKQAPKRPLPPERSQSTASDGQPPRKIIRLKINPQKVEAIQRSPPNPANSLKKSSSSLGSPAPRPFSALAAPSPVHSSLSGAPTSTPPAGGIVVKPARKPLPDSAPTPLVRKPSILLKLKTRPKESFPS